MGFDNDMTMFPPSHILSNHSHNICHSPVPLAPAFTPRRAPTLPMASTIIPDIDAARDYSLRSPILLRPFEYEERAAGPSRLRALTPPSRQRSPASELPDEIWLQIFGHLEQEEVLAIRPVCQAFSSLALAPALHRSLILHSLPPLPLPPMLVDHILPSLQHLHLHLFPFPATLHRDPHPGTILMALLDAIPANQLISLSLPFSAPYLPATELGQVLGRIGAKLEKLDLRGSGLTGSDYLEWIEHVGVNGKGLKELDLAFTSISALPGAATLDEIDAAGEGSETGPWNKLQRLSLASCTSLSAPVLAQFLAHLPPSISTLDISRLEQVTLPALRNLRVVHQLNQDDLECTKLRDLKLVGIDHLTRVNIRTLKRHWEDQRVAVLPSYMVPLPIAIPAPRVWGEPGASPRTSSFFATPPNSAFVTRAAEVGSHGEAQSPMAKDASPPSTPSLTSRCSSASSQSSSSALSSAFGSSPASSASSYAFEDRMSMSRPSALSSHAALWSALADDRSDGMYASNDVYCSKLPTHTHLPTRLAAPAPLPLPTSPRHGGHGHGHGHSQDRCRRDSVFKGPSGFRSRLRSIDFDNPWPAPAQHKKGKGQAGVTINITHSAILESEDEEGYRMFIGEVAGAVQGPAQAMPMAQHAHGTGLFPRQSGTVGGLSSGLGLGPGLEMQGAWTYRAPGGAGLGLGM
jgi:hypothetical protein